MLICYCGNKFKYGDIVRFIDETQQGFENGEIVNIIEVRHKAITNKYVDGCLLMSKKGGCYGHRFELISHKKEIKLQTITI